MVIEIRSTSKVVTSGVNLFFNSMQGNLAKKLTRIKESANFCLLIESVDLSSSSQAGQTDYCILDENNSLYDLAGNARYVYETLEAAQVKPKRVVAHVKLSAGLSQIEAAWAVAHEISVHASYLLPYTDLLLGKDGMLGTVIREWPHLTANGALSESRQHLLMGLGKDPDYRSARDGLVAYVRGKDQRLGEKIAVYFDNGMAVARARGLKKRAESKSVTTSMATTTS